MWGKRAGTGKPIHKKAWQSKRALDRFGLVLADFCGAQRLAQQNFACLTSYIVGTKAIDKILSLYQQEIAGGLKIPVDLFIRDAVHAGKLRAACVFPFVTSFNLDEVKGSTLHEKNEKPSVMVLAVLRYSFFANCDLNEAKAHLDAAMGRVRRNADPHHDLIVRALDFVMSDEFKEF